MQTYRFNTPIDWADILNQVEQRGIGGAGDRETWIGLAASLQAAGGSDVHWQIFHAISRNSANYKNERDCRAVWKSFRTPRKYTVATVIKHLHDNGVTISHETDWRRPSATPLRQVPATPIAAAVQEYYCEQPAEYAATTSAAALRRSPLRNYLRRLLWGHDAYWRIADVWQAYGAGYDEPHELFRYYDAKGGLCKIKYSAHDAENGKRLRVDGAISIKQPKNAVRCFFGEHLLPNDGGKPVGIVESEKTALLMACCYPDVTWIATGGESNLAGLCAQPALNGRKVMIYPDVDGTDKWREIAHAHAWPIANERLSFYGSLASIDSKADIADYVIMQYKELTERPAMQTARSMAKQHPALWRLMCEFQCSVIV